MVLSLDRQCLHVICVRDTCKIFSLRLCLDVSYEKKCWIYRQIFFCNTLEMFAILPTTAIPLFIFFCLSVCLSVSLRACLSIFMLSLNLACLYIFVCLLVCLSLTRKFIFSNTYPLFFFSFLSLFSISLYLLFSAP